MSKYITFRILCVWLQKFGILEMKFIELDKKDALLENKGDVITSFFLFLYICSPYKLLYLKLKPEDLSMVNFSVKSPRKLPSYPPHPSCSIIKRIVISLNVVEEWD